MAGERETGALLFIGAPCHACRREEFLPLMCSGCRHKFCADHASPEAHRCASAERDFLVPLCPLCSEPPKGWRRGASATTTQRQIQRHWEAPSVAQGGCRVVLAEHGPSATRSATPRCGHASCSTVLHVAIKCSACKRDFCTSHRAPAQHACPAAPPKNAARPPSEQHRAPALPSLQGAAPMRAMADLRTKLRGPTEAASTSPIPQQARPRPSRAAQRRAAAERQSMIRAMQARYEKGLLSESEQVLLAEKRAEDAQAPPSTCPIA